MSDTVSVAVESFVTVCSRIHPSLLIPCRLAAFLFGGIVGFALVSVPVASAGEPAVTPKPVPHKPASAPAPRRLPGKVRVTVTSTNSTSYSYTLEYVRREVSDSVRKKDNSNPTANGTASAQSENWLNRMLRRHLNKDEEFRLVTEDSHYRGAKLLSSVSAGYGSFFKDDSVLSRGQNGTRREEPGSLFLRTSFDF